MKTMYRSLFTGSSIFVAKIVGILKTNGIMPIVKDYNESGRLAGFGQIIPNEQEVVVSNDEWNKANDLLETMGI